MFTGTQLPQISTMDGTITETDKLGFCKRLDRLSIIQEFGPIVHVIILCYEYLLHLTSSTMLENGGVLVVSQAPYTVGQRFMVQDRVGTWCVYDGRASARFCPQALPPKSREMPTLH